MAPQATTAAQNSKTTLKEKAKNITILIFVTVFPTIMSYITFFRDTNISIPHVINIDFKALGAAMSIGISFGVAFYYIYRQNLKIRRLQVVLSAVHMLDNHRFHVIKDHFKNKTMTDDITDLMNPQTQDEERMIRSKLLNDTPDVTEEEISIIVNGFYHGSNKYKGV